jgi:small basic protein
MILLPLFALALGILIAFLVEAPFGGGVANYLSVAALAGFDSVVGGSRAALEGRFNAVRFGTAFVGNGIAAAALAYFGDQIGLDLFLAAVVVFGGRILVNLSIIRRRFLSGVERESDEGITPPPAPE